MQKVRGETWDGQNGAKSISGKTFRPGRNNPARRGLARKTKIKIGSGHIISENPSRTKTQIIPSFSLSGKIVILLNILMLFEIK
jgi:hypothetical protein